MFRELLTRNYAFESVAASTYTNLARDRLERSETRNGNSTTPGLRRLRRLLLLLLLLQRRLLLPLPPVLLLLPLRHRHEWPPCIRAAAAALAVAVAVTLSSRSSSQNRRRHLVSSRLAIELRAIMNLLREGLNEFVGLREGRRHPGQFEMISSSVWNLCATAQPPCQAVPDLRFRLEHHRDRACSDVKDMLHDYARCLPLHLGFRKLEPRDIWGDGSG